MESVGRNKRVTINAALNYLLENQYNSIGLKDSYQNVILAYNTPHSGMLEAKKKEIVQFFNRLAMPGNYYVSGRRGARGLALDIPVVKGNEEGQNVPMVSYNSNMANQMHGLSENEANLMAENALLRERLEAIESNLAENEPSDDNLGLGAMLKEYGPLLLGELFKHFATMQAPKPAPTPPAQQKRTIDIVELANMAETETKKDMINKMRLANPDLYQKYLKLIA